MELILSLLHFKHEMRDSAFRRVLECKYFKCSMFYTVSGVVMAVNVTILVPKKNLGIPRSNLKIKKNFFYIS